MQENAKAVNTRALTNGAQANEIERNTGIHIHSCETNLVEGELLDPRITNAAKRGRTSGLRAADWIHGVNISRVHGAEPELSEEWVVIKALVTEAGQGIVEGIDAGVGDGDPVVQQCGSRCEGDTEAAGRRRLHGWHNQADVILVGARAVVARKLPEG